MKLLFIGFGATGIAIANKLDLNNEIYFYDVKKIKSKFKQIKLNDIKNINFDYIIITLSSISKNKRKKLALIYKSTLKMRNEEFISNIKKIARIIPYIKNNKATIIVISNPIDDIITYLTKKISNQVIGFGIALDSKRYSAELNNNIDCIGVHGNSIPLIDLKNKSEYLNLHSIIDEKLYTFISKNGISYSLVANEFYDFFKKFNLNSKTILFLSKYDEKYSCSLSLPYYVKQGKIISDKKIRLNKIQKELLKESLFESN
jgi:malate/lactate dehydrogenase